LPSASYIGSSNDEEQIEATGMLEAALCQAMEEAKTRYRSPSIFCIVQCLPNATVRGERAAQCSFACEREQR